MSKLDDLGAWRAFLMFAKTGSLTAAAQSLNVDASVVSRAISALEKSLGCELIHHSVRPLQLTETGKIVVKRMGQIVKAHDLSLIHI